MQATAKHTPGPWKIGLPWAPPNGGYTIESDGAYVADVFAGHHPHDVVSPAIGKANARLIAAAPDLLEALHEIMVGANTEHGTDLDYRSRDEIAEIARAAIAKAEGE